MNFIELKEYLDFKADQYDQKEFIDTDPISLPHLFTKKEDVEIIAFLVATIAWGKRQMIIKNGQKLLEIMGNAPHDFILNYHSGQPLDFVHRTFNSIDLDFFFRSLQSLYHRGIGLEGAFSEHPSIEGVKGRIVNFRDEFLSVDHEKRSEKHISNPLKNSAAKRINMFLRWMVRQNSSVDFGIWKTISPADLYLPLDVHTSRNARALGLITRKQDDWKALEELMGELKKMDESDPVKYDFALFGIGAFEDNPLT